MKFMVQVRATAQSEAGAMPSAELVAAMTAFNEELAGLGMLLAGEGLQDSSKGARLAWTDGALTITDGPFAETNELIAGYWLIEAASKAQVVEVFSRCPPPADHGNGVLEIRQLFGMEDFPEEVFTPEIVAREVELRARLDQA